MPQMAPISWLTLFVMFSFTFIIFNIMNYYNYFLNNNNSDEKNNMSSDNTQKEFKNKILNWKW